MSGRQLASRAALLFLLAGQGADFLRTAKAAASAGSVSLTFTSDDVGALAVVFVQSSTTTPNITASAGGWTTTDPGDYDLGSGTLWQRRIFSKVIAAGDVTSGLTVGSISSSASGEGGYVLWLGKGASSLSVISNTSTASSATTLTIPSHTPAATGLGVIAFVVDTDNPITGIDTFAPPTAPAGVTRQAAGIAGGFAYGLYEWAGPDDTGQALVFTGFDTSSAQNGVLIELLP